MNGNNIELLKELEDNSVDSVVTDPPYGLSFMNKKWDYDVPSVEFWNEVFRVLKPGGHVLSFGGTRTYHRMVVNIEDAGFEIRDQIMWLYGSGFPKSHNIGKSVDKLLGNDREVVGNNPNHRTTSGLLELGFQDGKETSKITKGNSDWEGWGTALKPANEPICVARKPLSEKTITENVLKWGTGGINIDGCRIGTDDKLSRPVFKTNNTNIYGGGKGMPPIETLGNDNGRFPANIILDEDAGKVLDNQSGISGGGSLKKQKRKRSLGDNCYGEFNGIVEGIDNYGDSGGASRFFYSAKVSKKERNLTNDNNHPTIKPISLMSYLVRLVTPKGGIVLDPFMGSGSTGISSQLEGFKFIGMEMDENYFKIAETRINNWEEYKRL